MSELVFVQFFLVFVFVIDICSTANTNGNVCYQQKLSEFTEPALSKYETLMDTLLILLEEQKMCKCLQNRVRDLENEIERLRQQIRPMKDCSALYGVGEREDGIYTISPDGRTSFPVYCDLSNGGWTVIQRRIDGAVNFERVWVDYARGFGNLTSNIWLGLRFIHLLANQQNEISFEFTMKETGRNASAVYRNFTVEDEDTFFRMHVSREAVYNNEMSKHITNDNGFFYHNGMQFTTKDSDHDQHSTNCALSPTLMGGFWYNACYRIAGINSPYNKLSLWDTKVVLLSKTEVKIRRQV